MKNERLVEVEDCVTINKIGIDRLIIELTRWCNMQCPHCLRGERERLRNKKQYIDRILENVNYISLLTFTGGEPTLAVDLIEYTLEQCKMRDIAVYSVWATTNGKIKSRKFLRVMREFIGYTQRFDGELSGISLSTDQYHDCLPEENYWFYRDFEYFENSKDVGFLKSTIPEGRAANGLDTNNYMRVLEDYLKAYLYEDELQIEEGDIYLNAKGDITLNCDYSYDTQEYRKIFNIMDCSLAQGLIENGFVFDGSVETA